MTSVTVFRSTILEFGKTKRKPIPLLFLALLMLDLAYLFWGMTPAEAAAPQMWEQTLFSISLINTVFLSIVCAVLASQAMDLEHKGHTWNLLQTLQSRISLYLGKILYGLVWLSLFAATLGILVLIIGSRMGFQGELPVSQVIRLCIFQILSGMVVYQIGCLLSLVFGSQFAALSINLGGTLTGFFTMYITDRAVTPWSLYVALRIVNMNYPDGAASPTVSWEWVHASPQTLTAAILYFVISLAAGLVIISRMEEDHLTGASERRIRSSRIHSPLPAELIKLKRSPVWIPFFIIPAITAFIGTINFWANQGELSFTWDALWTQHSLFLGVFFLSPLIGVLCSFLLRSEHSGTNWNLVLSVESPWKLVKDKMLVASGVSTLCIFWVALLYIGCGIGLGLPGMPPAAFYECIAYGALASIAICAVQIFLSLVIRSFAVPIGIALAGSALGLAFVIKGWIFVLPYAMLQTGLKSTSLEWNTNPVGFVAAGLLYIAFFYFLSVFYLKHSDVKTHE